jgi:hypothetical protein
MRGLRWIRHQIAHLLRWQACMNDIVHADGYWWHRVYCKTCGQEAFRFKGGESYR